MSSFNKRLYKKKDFPVDDARFYLEPSPAFLLTSKNKNESTWKTVIL